MYISHVSRTFYHIYIHLEHFVMLGNFETFVKNYFIFETKNTYFCFLTI